MIVRVLHTEAADPRDFVSLYTVCGGVFETMATVPIRVSQSGTGETTGRQRGV
jgi:hypothetical protein